MSDPQAVRQLFDAIEARFGGIDVVVNSAGVLQLAPLADTDDALFERVIGINLRGASTCCAKARDGSARRWPADHPVHQRGRHPAENYSAYAASKAAVETMGAILSAARAQHHRERRGADRPPPICSWMENRPS